MTNDEESINYQLGAESVDKSAVDGTELIPFKMESSVVFRRLAEDIYPSPKAGIREAITNAITATKKVNNIDDFEPVINISVDGTLNPPKLIIEDNGIGMTMETIREVVSYIGRSTVRDDHTKSGQFGMGFLALFSLCGSDGGFIMHTQYRNNNSEPISGIWKDGGFSKFDEPLINDDMVGTKFEIILREDISVKDIRKWVQDISEWSRVSILYEDKTDEGVYSDEFGVLNIQSLVKDNKLSISVDNEYYTAISSPNLEHTPTILLDVLIERNIDNIPYVPFNDLAIRLKSEHPVVMEGENEGKMIIRNIEYEQLPSERKKLYVPERDVDDDIPVTPSPTGTREKLKKNKQFWMSVGKELKKAQIEKSKQIINSITGKQSTSIQDYKFIENALFTKLDNYKRFDSFIKSKYSDIYSKQISQKLYALLQKVHTYKYNPKTNSVISLNKKKVYDIINENYDYTFMFISTVNDEKAMKIHASNDSYIFVKINDSNWYDFYQDNLNWDRLKDVSSKHPICENITEEDIDRLSNNDINNSQKSNTNNILNIKLHDSNKKIYIDDIPEKIDTKDNTYILKIANQEIEKLIIFPYNSDYKIRDYNWLRSNNTAIVYSKTNKITNELKNMPVSITIDSYIESANNTELLTSNGRYTCDNISFKDSIVHIIPDEMYDLIKSENNIEKIATLFDENIFSAINSPDKQNYIPITKSKFYDILPVINNAILYNTCSFDTSMDSDKVGPSTAQCKLYLIQFENRDTDIIREIDSKICEGKPLTNERISIISLFEEISNTNINLKEVSINE